MIDLAPLEPLYEVPLGRDLPLPPALAAVYGPLAFPPHAGRPYVFANFVQTLDGVVTLGMPGLLDPQAIGSKIGCAIDQAAMAWRSVVSPVLFGPATTIWPGI